ncbi:hypothetical protein AgCh_025994 [Apium graveolens]
MPRRPIRPWQNRVSAPLGSDSSKWPIVISSSPSRENRSDSDSSDSERTLDVVAEETHVAPSPVPPFVPRDIPGASARPRWVRRSVSAVRDFPPGCGPNSSSLRPLVPLSSPSGVSSPIPYHVHRAVNRSLIREQIPELAAYLDQIPVGPFQGIPVPSPDVQARVRYLTQTAIERARYIDPFISSEFRAIQDVQPPKFKGEVDPVASRIWLKEMEKAFALTKVSEDLKTDYATYFLKNDSNYWWESTRELEGEESDGDGVLELKQGDISVTEYEAKFTELVCIAPEYAALVIESDQSLAAKEQGEKKRKFESGPARFMVRPYNGQVRPMCALDPVVRAVLCAFLGIAAMADSFIPVSADHSEPLVGGPSSDPRPAIPPVLAIVPPPVLQPVPLQAIPPRGVPFQFSSYPVPYHQFEACLMEQRFLQGQILELLHIMRTREVGSGERRLRERLQAFRRATAVRIAEATHEDITPDFLVEWAKWVLEELEEIGGLIDPAIAQILQILAQQTVHLAQQQQRQTNPQVTFKTFQAVNPPEFKGSLEPIEANVWLKEIEKAFTLVKVKEEQKVEFASYYLKNEATYWWEIVKTLEGTYVITWERFKELFLEKYFPQFFQDQMELKFLELKQGNMSVVDYESKFEELSRYVPSYVDTDRKKAKRFQQGVVQKAMIAEIESEMSQKEKESKKRKFEGNKGQSQPGKFPNFKKGKFQPGRNFNFKRQNAGDGGQGNRPVNANQPNQLRLTFPDCQVCGKKHGGVCNQLNVVCFKYNQKGHYSRECRNQPAKEPANKDQPIRNPAVKVPVIGFTCFKCGKPGHIARDCKTPAPVSNALRIMGSTPAVNETPRAGVFDMSVKDAIQDTDVVAGTLNVNSLCAKVLIDSGATRSFVSQDFISKLNYPVEYLNEIMTVELANQERVSVNQVCGNCEIEISGSKFCVDLIPFKLGEFDVILGMDWLSKHDAQIDCRNRKVMVKMPDERIVTSQEPAKLEDIPVVNEFPDMFPDKLPGLSPEREIEFAIDLAPGT